MAKLLYSVKEIADICGKNPRTIRYFAEAEGLGRKLGKEWKFAESEAQLIIRHYSVSSETAEETEDKTEDVEVNTEKAETNKTPAQTANSELAETLRILNQQLEQKDKQIEQLMNEISAKSEQINELIKTNNNLSLPQATKAFSEAQEIMNAEPIQEKKEIESAGAVQSDSMTNDEWATLATWERLKRAWKGVLNG